jgi:hypothetical protein
LLDHRFEHAPFDIGRVLVEQPGAEALPANPPNLALCDRLTDELEGVVLVSVRVEDVRDAVVDTPLEPAVDVLFDVSEGVVLVVSDVRVGLPDVVADRLEMVVTPVLLGEQSACVLLDERGEAVACLVLVVGNVKLFSEMYR